MCNPSLSSVSFSNIYKCTQLLRAVYDIVGPGSNSICPKVRELEGAIPFMSPVIRIIKDRGSVMVIVSHPGNDERSEEHTSELQSRGHLVCRLLLEKKHNPSLATHQTY